MNKIKDIFSPGHAQDADMLYGSQQSANTGRLSGEGSHFGNARDDAAGIASTAKGHNRSDTMDPADPSSATTASDTAAERGQGFARQTVNPDEGRAESAGAAATALPDRTAGGIHSTPVAEKDASRRQQIVNPEDSKYDNSGTLEPTPTRFSKESGLEPVGGVSRSSEHGQGIVGTQPATGSLRPSKFADKDDISVASVRSGVIGDTPHAKELTDTDLPAGTHDTPKSGHGIGPGAAAAAAGTAAALGSTTERSFPLSGGTTTETSGTRGDYPSRDEPSTLGRSTEASTSGVTTGTHRSGYDRSGLAAAAASTAFDNHKHGGRYHEYEGPNTDTITSGPTFTSGPHATETANRLDPNLPSPNLPSSSMPGAYPDSAAATPASEVPSTTTNTTTGPSSREHHYGRDAAIAGAGAATAGALYEARSRETAGPEPVRAADRTQRISSQDYGQDTAMAGAGTAAARGPHGTHHREPTEAVYAPKSETVRDAPSQEHHYGRDAAIAGASAAAAGGLYEARRKGSTETDPATKTHGPHKSNLANIMDPRVLPDPDKMKGHHAQSTETDPASKTVGPHSSNIANVLDPMVVPQPEKMKQHTTAGPHQSDSLNRMDPRVDSDPAKEANQHHYGRDAAIAGGLGAGAAGAYAASQQHSEKNPYTSHAVDPRVHGSSTTSETPARTASKKGGWFAGPVGSAVDNNKVPASSTTPSGTTGYGGSSTSQPDQQHHYGRDAAIAGGAGLAGAGIAHQYGEHKADRAAQDHASGTTGTSGPYSSSHAQQPQTTSTSQPTSQHHHGREPAVAGAVGATAYEYQKAEAKKAERAHPYGTTTSPTGEQVSGSTDPARTSADSDKKHHHGRDAAVAGAAGAAGAGAAHEFSKHDAEKAEKERLKEQKALEKEEKKHQKELEKEHEKEEKEHEKEEKKHQKELEKEQKKHEKEVEKEQKELEKEEKKKHHGGLFGFLHRDKDKDEEKTVEHDDKHHRHEKEAGAVAAGTAGAAAYDHEHDKHERNRLHKDPPAEYVAKAHEGEHYGTDGRTEEPGTVSSLQGAHPGEYGAVKSGGQEGVVTEPHTGLPMNVGKYGSGAGGTDGNETIQGFRGYDAGTEASGPNVSSQGSAHGGTIGPDWQNVKKSNTPY